MRRFGAICMCVVAATVVAGVSAAGAVAAEPALYECVKASKETVKYKKGTKEKSKAVYTGEYTEKRCATKAPRGKYRAEGKPEGKYTAKEGIGKGKAFSGSGAGANLEAQDAGGIVCSGSTDTGKFTSPTSAGDIIVKFTGCEYNGRKCKSPGAVEGEIVTKPLAGTVGYLAGKGTPTPTTGADIKAETGEVLATFDCKEVDFAVTGSVIGEVGPANVFTKEATFTFKQKGVGVQEWTKFEEGPEDVLTVHLCNNCEPLSEGGAALPSSEETTVKNVGEELMLKA